MNFISLFFINLQQIIKKHKLVYCTIIMFMFFAMFFTLFVQNAFTIILKNMGNVSEDYIMKVSIKYDDIDTLSSIIKNYDIQNAYCTFDYNNNIVKVLIIPDKTENILLGENITPGDIKSKQNVIIVPHKTSDINIGDSYEFMGTTYIIKGTSNNYIVPYYIVDHNLINEVTIIVNPLMSEKNINNLKDELKRNNITITQNIYPEKHRVSEIISLFTTILVSVGIINILYLYNYGLQQRTDNFALYTSWGLSRKKLKSYLLFEFMIYLVAMVIAGSFVYYITFNLMFDNTIFKNHLTINNYMFTAVVFIMFFTLCFNLLVKKFISKISFKNYNQ